MIMATFFPVQAKRIAGSYTVHLLISLLLLCISACHRDAEQAPTKDRHQAAQPKAPVAAREPDPFASSPGAAASQPITNPSRATSLGQRLSVSAHDAQIIDEKLKAFGGLIVAATSDPTRDHEVEAAFNKAAAVLSDAKHGTSQQLRLAFDALFPNGHITPSTDEMLRRMKWQPTATAQPTAFTPDEYACFASLIQSPEVLADVRPELLQNFLVRQAQRANTSLSDLLIYYGVLTASSEYPDQFKKFDGSLGQLTSSQNPVYRMLALKLARLSTKDPSRLSAIYNAALDNPDRSIRLAALDEIQTTRLPGAHEMATMFARRARDAGDAQAETRANEVAALLAP